MVGLLILRKDSKDSDEVQPSYLSTTWNRCARVSFEDGCPGRARTCDHTVNSGALYQLSYRTKKKPAQPLSVR